ncbi:hypothetical protein AB6A40_010493 [Gnathostoma spinigerum]|uniref:Uncharacterized protein n=1 Tax=Gnathostoma spinigerum TaxID=75299 RepID=A0ABD6EZW3_9BILA
MNGEQLQGWLVEFSSRCQHGGNAVDDTDSRRVLLDSESAKTRFLIKYISCNYSDVDLIHPVVGQLLASYYRGGRLL